MKLDYKGKIYVLGVQKTLQEMKNKIFELIQELEKREIIIFIQQKETKFLLQEKNYEKLITMNNNTEQFILKCYILEDYLQNMNFQFQQLNHQNKILQSEKEQNNQIDLKQKQNQQNMEQQSFTNKDFVSIQKNDVNIQTQQIEQSTQQLNHSLQPQTEDEIINPNRIEYQQEHTQSIQQENLQSNKLEEQSQERPQQIFESILSRSSLRLEDRMNQGSIFIEFFQNCMNCGKKIEDYSIMLSCCHVFHESCLKEIFKSQIEQKNSILQCLCNQKILHARNFLKKLDIEGYFQELLKNQINNIRQQNNKRIRNCTNQACNFFMIIQQNLGSKSFCPNCLMMVNIDSPQ
ncbi:unnamed protein product [Paramecium sonneborni]|uniref:RING-type domain-containing protein n=1 Tax=Paramecium sonneborni TaxID=65129 RepID=A0A8S1RBP6_9CILI|nr:unnamed protein product [Paramecium sonneborni]